MIDHDVIHDTASSPLFLFDLLSGNAIAAYASESEALAALRDSATEDGVESIENLSLLLMQDGHPTLIAMEGELVRRALGDELPVSSVAKQGLSKSRSIAS